MSDGRVLVAGATGQLGGAVARQLLEAGVPIRALGRNREKLQPLADAGAEVAAVDLMDNRALADACKGITQIVRFVNELQARLMTLGYHATTSRPFPDWRKNAERFGVAPRTVEDYVQHMATP